jgi:hypothetical protein
MHGGRRVRGRTGGSISDSVRAASAIEMDGGRGAEVAKVTLRLTDPEPAASLDTVESPPLSKPAGRDRWETRRERRNERNEAVQVREGEIGG